MRSPLLTKYGFRIRTRIGFVVDRLMIPASDPAQARQKLRQIYRDCEILECVCHRDGVRTPVPNDEKPATRLAAMLA
jgi:hypothetical protein